MKIILSLMAIIGRILLRKKIKDAVAGDTPVDDEEKRKKTKKKHIIIISITGSIILIYTIIYVLYLLYPDSAFINMTFMYASDISQILAKLLGYVL